MVDKSRIRRAQMEALYLQKRKIAVMDALARNVPYRKNEKSLKSQSLRTLLDIIPSPRFLVAQETFHDEQNDSQR